MVCGLVRRVMLLSKQLVQNPGQLSHVYAVIIIQYHTCIALFVCAAHTDLMLSVTYSVFLISQAGQLNHHCYCNGVHVMLSALLLSGIALL